MSVDPFDALAKAMTAHTSSTVRVGKSSRISSTAKQTAERMSIPYQTSARTRRSTITVASRTSFASTSGRLRVGSASL
jgi:anaerobic glycerol-3-phosphate dehydrogenase